MKDIPERLRKARGNTPRADVCKAVSISLSTLAMYENGLRVPRDEIKIRLSAYYKIPVGELFY